MCMCVLYLFFFFFFFTSYIYDAPPHFICIPKVNRSLYPGVQRSFSIAPLQ